MKVRRRTDAAVQRTDYGYVALKRLRVLFVNNVASFEEISVVATLRWRLPNMKKILIIDGHIAARAGMAGLLRLELGAMNAVVGEVADGMEAMRRLDESAWDLVLLDLNISGWSGSETLVRIKRKFPRLPVLVVSAYSAERYAQQMRQGGARGYLDKNFCADDLVSAVKVLLEGGSWFKSRSVHMTETINKANPEEELRDAGLTPREFEVFRHMCKGLDRTSIAQALGISTSAISKARAGIRGKLQVTRNADVISYAVKAGLLDAQGSRTDYQQ